MTELGAVSFVPTAQRPAADQALVVAHNLILQVLGVQNERFQLEGLEKKLKICMQDFIDMRKNKTARAPEADEQLGMET
jgi:hypothetical protein